MYSFRLYNTTAYGEGSQTWMEWLSTLDYSRWSLDTDKVITCESLDNEVFIDGHETSLSGL